VKKVSTFFLKFIFLILLLYLILRKVDTNRIYDEFKHINLIYFIISAFFYFISTFTAAFQWRYLLKIQNIKISYPEVLEFTYMGLFFNSFLPSSTGGDVYKVYKAGKKTSNWGRILSATFLDRVYGFIVLILIGLFGTIISFSYLVDKKLIVFISLIAFLFFMIITLLIVISEKVFLITTYILEKFRLDNLIPILKNFRLYTIFTIKQKKILIIFFISFLTQMLRIISNYYAAKSLNVDIPFVLFLSFIPIIGTAVAIPISFGGVGVREYLSMELFGNFTTLEKAILMQTLAYLGTLIVNSLGIFVLIYDWFFKREKLEIENG